MTTAMFDVQQAIGQELMALQTPLDHKMLNLPRPLLNCINLYSEFDYTDLADHKQIWVGSFLYGFSKLRREFDIDWLYMFYEGLVESNYVSKNFFLFQQFDKFEKAIKAMFCKIDQVTKQEFSGQLEIVQNLQRYRGQSVKRFTELVRDLTPIFPLNNSYEINALFKGEHVQDIQNDDEYHQLALNHVSRPSWVWDWSFIQLNDQEQDQDQDQLEVDFPEESSELISALA